MRVRSRTAPRARGILRLLWVGLPLVLGGPLVAQEDAIAIARATARSLQEECGIPGLSVAVAKDGELVWAEGFGMADLEHRVAVTPATRFRCASLSKPLAAAAAARLAQRGVLDLDADVRTLVPAWPAEHDAGVTTRLLLGHLGGVRHYLPYETDDYARPTPSVTAALARFAESPLVAEPGERYVYSTYGFTLAAAAMEGASGEEFLSLMSAEVFTPLGLTATSAEDPRAITPDRTRYFERAPGGGVRHAPYTDHSYKWAGGGFQSTPSDLVRFASAFLEPGYLEESMLETVFTSQKTRDGERTGYGLGWGVGRDAHGRTASHTGSQTGTRTALLLHRDAGYAVAVMGNLSGAPIRGETSRALLAPFLAADCTPQNRAEVRALLGTWQVTATVRERELVGDLVLSLARSGISGSLTTSDPAATDGRRSLVLTGACTDTAQDDPAPTLRVFAVERNAGVLRLTLRANGDGLVVTGSTPDGPLRGSATRTDD